MPWTKPGDDVENVTDMKAVHAWQGNEVLTNADIDYVVGDPNNPADKVAREADWRWKYAVTKAVNVMMK